MSKCDLCPLKNSDARCRGESIPHKCDDSRYREYFAKMPPLAEQAANLAGSLLDWAKSGFAMAPDHIRDERLKICQDCPHYIDNRCSQCGCYMKGAKINISTSQCPLGHWGSYAHEKAATQRDDGSPSIE